MSKTFPPFSILIYLEYRSKRLSMPIHLCFRLYITHLIMPTYEDYTFHQESSNSMGTGTR